MSDEKKPIGKILLQQRAVTQEQLDGALGGGEGRLATRLREQGLVTDVEALKALSEQYGVPGIDLSQICLRLADLDLLPREIAEKHLILPVLVRDDRLFIAMANPRERKVIDELEFVTGKKVYPYVALEGSLAYVIEHAYSQKGRGEEYFVGPECPAEVLRKVGIDENGARLDAQAEVPTGAFPGSPPSLRGSTVAPEPEARIVSDSIEAAGRADEVEDSDFGDVAEELSQVSPMPLAELGGPEPQEPAQGDGPTVLIVDDEEDIRKMLKKLLVSRGYRVVEADRGATALRMVKDHAPQLIVLDAMLPEIHGFDIARRIKRSQRYGSIPIIMVSAVYRGWRYAEDLKASCGVDHFIEKPFRIADVVRAVEQSLSPTAAEDSESRSRDEEVSAEAEVALNEGVAAYKAGRLAEAVEHLQRGIGIDPLAYRLHFHLGLLLGKQGKTYEAISALETAVDVNSRHFPAIKNLAVLYQKAGFRNKAAEMWERALSLAPDDDTKQSIRQHLLQLL